MCIGCTQLDGYGYSQRESKRILNEWIEFLSTNTKTFRALHFNSRVPQSLFDAACCQENLEELRFKWGAYGDISILANMKSLIVLHVENFKRIEDYSPLSNLENLEQLAISGPILGTTPVKDLEFLREMKSLVSVWLPNIRCRRKYTSEELANLGVSL